MSHFRTSRTLAFPRHSRTSDTKPTAGIHPKRYRGLEHPHSSINRSPDRGAAFAVWDDKPPTNCSWELEVTQRPGKSIMRGRSGTPVSLLLIWAITRSIAWAAIRS